MSLAESGAKAGIIEKFRLNDKDTGSPEVQVALLTKQLELLAEHFKSHPQDKHSQRGLLQIVAKRKKLLSYLRDEDVDRYRSIVTSLGLRK